MVVTSCDAVMPQNGLNGHWREFEMTENDNDSFWINAAMHGAPRVNSPRFFVLPRIYIAINGTIVALLLSSLEQLI